MEACIDGFPILVELVKRTRTFAWSFKACSRVSLVGYCSWHRRSQGTCICCVKLQTMRGTLACHQKKVMFAQ